MSRRVVLLAGSLVLVAVLALGAAGVFDVAGAVRDNRPLSGAPQAWAATRVLGVRSELAFRRAAALAAVPGGSVSARLRRHADAEALLSRLAAHGSARAANLLGTLELEDATLVPSRAPESLDAARDSFTRAVRADPGSEDAKYNLELLLTLLSQRKHERTGQQQRGDARQGTGTSRAGGQGY